VFSRRVAGCVQGGDAGINGAVCLPPDQFPASLMLKAPPAATTPVKLTALSPAVFTLASPLTVPVRIGDQSGSASAAL
jgi:hypothetical protein